MDNAVNGRDKTSPFYEIKQRYCSKLNTNVVMKRELGEEGAFTCMSSHICGENCRNSEKNADRRTR